MLNKIVCLPKEIKGFTIQANVESASPRLNNAAVYTSNFDRLSECLKINLLYTSSLSLLYGPWCTGVKSKFVICIYSNTDLFILVMNECKFAGSFV